MGNVLATTVYGQSYKADCLENVFRMVDLFNDLERHEAYVSAYGWQRIFETFGMQGILEFDYASGWLGIMESPERELPDLAELILTSGYNPLSKAKGKIEKDIFVEDCGNHLQMSELISEFTQRYLNICKNFKFTERTLPECNLNFEFSEGDILYTRYTDCISLVKILKVKTFDLKENEPVSIRGIEFRAKEGDKIKIVVFITGNKTYTDMNKLKRSVNRNSCLSSNLPITSRPDYFASGYKFIKNSKISLEELKGIKFWENSLINKNIYCSF